MFPHCNIYKYIKTFDGKANIQIHHAIMIKDGVQVYLMRDHLQELTVILLGKLERDRQQVNGRLKSFIWKYLISEG
jgi:hypothetical protein